MENYIGIETTLPIIWKIYTCSSAIMYTLLTDHGKKPNKSLYNKIPKEYMWK